MNPVRKANFVYIATSLDGYIAKTDGDLDWLQEIPNPNNDDYGYAEFMSTIDAVLMGRNTFEKVLTFAEWPYDKPVFVLSSTLTSVPEHLAGRVELLNSSPKLLVEQLRLRGYHNLYIDGGKTIQSFLKDDLIDEMIIARIPVLLGSGIPLFCELEHTLMFSHVKTETYGEIIKSRYIRTR